MKKSLPYYEKLLKKLQFYTAKTRYNSCVLPNSAGLLQHAFASENMLSLREIESVRIRRIRAFRNHYYQLNTHSHQDAKRTDTARHDLIPTLRQTNVLNLSTRVQYCPMSKATLQNWGTYITKTERTLNLFGSCRFRYVVAVWVSSRYAYKNGTMPLGMPFLHLNYSIGFIAISIVLRWSKRQHEASH